MKHALFLLLAFVAYGAAAQENRTDVGVQFLGFATDFGTGVVSQVDQPDIWGRRLGFGGAVKLAGGVERPFFLEFGWSVLDGDSQSRAAQVLAAGTPLVFATSVSPNGNMSLDSFADATGAFASAVVTLTSAGGGETGINSTTSSPLGGQTSVWAYSPTDGGGLFTSVVTDGTVGIARAVGLIFDETGAVMMTEGTDQHVPATVTRSDNITFRDGSVKLGTLVPLGNDWNALPRGGLIMRSLERSTVLKQTIDIVDGFVVDDPTPELSIIQNTDLRVDMAGVSIGSGFSRQLSDAWRISFGADIGVLQGRSRYTTHDAVWLDTNVAQNIAGPRGRADKVMQTGRVSVGLSRQLKAGGVLSLGLYSDVTTGVPYLERVTLGEVIPVQSDDSSGTSLDVAEETNQDFRVRYGRMTNSGVSLAFVWVF